MVCLETPPSKRPLHTENSQPISIANQNEASIRQNPSLRAISEQTLKISVA